MQPRFSGRLPVPPGQAKRKALFAATGGEEGPSNSLTRSRWGLALLGDLLQKVQCLLGSLDTAASLD
jgi:hypothetical protein